MKAYIITSKEKDNKSIHSVERGINLVPHIHKKGKYLINIGSQSVSLTDESIHHTEQNKYKNGLVLKDGYVERVITNNRFTSSDYIITQSKKNENFYLLKWSIFTSPEQYINVYPPIQKYKVHHNSTKYYLSRSIVLKRGIRRNDVLYALNHMGFIIATICDIASDNVVDRLVCYRKERLIRIYKPEKLTSEYFLESLVHEMGVVR